MKPECGGEAEGIGQGPYSAKIKHLLYPPCAKVGLQNPNHPDPTGGAEWETEDEVTSWTGRQQQEEEREHRDYGKQVTQSEQLRDTGEPPASSGGQILISLSRTWQFGSKPAASSCDLTSHLLSPKALGWGLESSAGRMARKNN